MCVTYVVVGDEHNDGASPSSLVDDFQEAIAVNDFDFVASSLHRALPATHLTLHALPRGLHLSEPLFPPCRNHGAVLALRAVASAPTSTLSPPLWAHTPAKLLCPRQFQILSPRKVA